MEFEKRSLLLSFHAASSFKSKSLNISSSHSSCSQSLSESSFANKAFLFNREDLFYICLGIALRDVFDRAHAERSLGNTLDRPSLLMKRLFTRKTEMDQEVLAGGSKYDALGE